MTIDAILVSAGPGETRIALMAAGRLRDAAFHRGTPETATGEIRLGRVVRVVPGIQAAFVDIGADRAGFLGVAEARPLPAADADAAIGDFVSEGDTVLVQVLRDALEDKGVKLTTRPALNGRYVVFLPGQAEVRLSRRIDDRAERDRLAALAGELAGDGDGFIVRTAAVGMAAEVLAREAGSLRRRWSGIAATAAAASPPALLYAPDADPVLRLLREVDAAGLRRIVVDDATLLAALRRHCADWMPDLAPLLHGHDGPETLFEAHGAEEQIEAALAPAAPLSSGGSILIEETAALVAIDVNSGPRSEGLNQAETAYRTNLEAADEIARQIVLRDLSGLIVIDFVGSRRRDHRQAVLDHLRRALADDPQACNVAGFTPLGLVEMTRPRGRRSLRDRLTVPCAACAGGRVRAAESVAADALRAVLRAARAAPGAEIVLRVAPPVAAVLAAAMAGARAEVEERLGRPLVVAADAALPQERFDVEAPQRRPR